MRLNRSDRRVLLLLFAVVIAFWGGVLLDRWLLQPRSSLVSLDEVAMDSFDAEWSGADSLQMSGGGYLVRKGESDNNSGYYAVPVQQSETFPFDPNTADSTTFLRLGLAPWQVRSIYKYRARGGRYHRPEDFKRLPGMTPELWNRLASFVRIGEPFRYYEREDLDRERNAGRVAGRDDERLSEDSSSYPYQEKFSEVVELDLNAVDSATLKKVPGIASYRARQILNYRDRLGGFVSSDQLSEVEGVPVELQEWFTVKKGVFRKINLNSASVGQLARHPYVGSARAKAIVNYRRAQGRIRSLADLSLLPDFSSEVIARLEPYVEF